MEKYITLQMVLHFLAYFSVSTALVGVFTWLYVKVTPYNEFVEIKNGNVHSAISLVGAVIGFTIPLLVASMYGISLVDFIVWACVAMVVQMAVFFVAYRYFDYKLHENMAAAVTYAGLCIITGLINGFSLIP